jgi:hypothetical protein
VGKVDDVANRHFVAVALSRTLKNVGHGKSARRPATQ